MPLIYDVGEIIWKLCFKSSFLHIFCLTTEKINVGRKVLLFASKNALKTPHASCSLSLYMNDENVERSNCGEVEKLPSPRVCQTNIYFILHVCIKNIFMCSFILPIGFTFYLLMHFFSSPIRRPDAKIAERRKTPHILDCWEAWTKYSHKLLSIIRTTDAVSFGCVINFIRTDLKLVSRWSVYWLTCISSVPYHDVFYEYVESNRSRSCLSVAHASRWKCEIFFLRARAQIYYAQREVVNILFCDDDKKIIIIY